jgi:cytochrome c biogenesis protein CcmG, thiol:disulfide interchange protein DsbE
MRAGIATLLSMPLLLLGAAWATVAVPLLDALQLAKPTSRLEAPAFDLATPSGRSVRLADLRGRPVLLYFWATW